MEQIKYLHIIRNLNIVKLLLEKRRYNDIDNEYKYLFNDKDYETISPAVKLNITKLEETIKLSNYGIALDAVNKIIKALEKRVFSFKCDKIWFDLLYTENENVRFCSDCSRNVFKVNNEIEFLKRAELGQCVFYMQKELNSKSIKSCVISKEDKHFELLGAPFFICEERHESDKELPFEFNNDIYNDDLAY